MNTSPARILLVEDDVLIRNSLAGFLRGADMVVREMPDGFGLLEAAEEFRPDLALLDVMLPGQNGLALAQSLRRQQDVPIVFVTARDGVHDRLRGFEVGADDYLVKPFVAQEMLARVRAVLRRTGRGAPTTLDLGSLVIDEKARIAVHGGHRIDLTATEFALLLHLAHHRGRTLSKTQILTQVWGYEDFDPNLVEVHVSALRRKLEQHGPRMVHTVRGMGYVLRPDRSDAVAPVS